MTPPRAGSGSAGADSRRRSDARVDSSPVPRGTVRLPSRPKQCVGCIDQLQPGSLPAVGSSRLHPRSRKATSLRDQPAALSRPESLYTSSQSAPCTPAPSGSSRTRDSPPRQDFIIRRTAAATLLFSLLMSGTISLTRSGAGVRFAASSGLRGFIP